MRNRANDNKSAADPAAAHVEISFYPYRDDTPVGVVLVRGLGARAVRLSVWSGHLPVRRASLAGMGACDVTELLCGELWSAFRRSHDHPLAEPAHASGEAAPAPLEGPQGGDWWQAQLPLGSS